MATDAPQLLSTDFEAAIARNKRNTVILIAVMTAISAVMGYVFGWAYGILHDVWTQPSSHGLDLTVGGVMRTSLTSAPICGFCFQFASICSPELTIFARTPSWAIMGQSANAWLPYTWSPCGCVLKR